ncbi:MAG: pantetheine-phosphate adenylyltransferase [Oscillospiraceae bacterium]|nr:pantetheine-phosphate adenylyltransferase [Oscillospiraceae bacterium]
MRRAIYPGSFDPVTLGHLDIIKRAAAIFDELIVCVSVNSAKDHGLFSPEERVELIRRVTEDLPNVRVDCSRDLVAEYARRNRSRVLVKGLRAVSDYEAEIQMAMINAKLYPKLDTVFLYTRPKYAYLSSTVVKEMARYGADLSDFVPRQIIDQVRSKVEASAAQVL